MQPSEELVEFIKQTEGFRPKAYWDVDGWAVGYGTHADDVSKSTVWTDAQADKALRGHLAAVASIVERLVKVPLTQGQFDALCDFCYNLGAGRMAESTLLKLLNQKAYTGAGQQLLRWDMVEGKHNATILARRQAELTMWNGEPK
jgi:lysozyme